MTEIETTAEELVEQIGDAVEVSQSEIEEKLQQLVSEYNVPLGEAERSVINSYADQEDVDTEELRGGGNETLLVNEIDQDEQWGDVIVQVTDLDDDTHESIAQSGLFGDESGDTRFVAFESSDLETLEEGTSYRLEGIVTDEYEGNYSVKLVSTTDIIELEEDVEVGDGNVTVSGTIMGLSGETKSGLIKRCPQDECTQVLESGRCDDHGNQDNHEFDLRLQLVIDDGETAHDVQFNREEAEALTGMTLEEAKAIGKEEMDVTVVRDRLHDQLIGQYLTVTGNPIYGYVFADEFSRGIETPDSETLLTKARSL